MSSEIILESLPEIYDTLMVDLEKTEGGPEIQLKTLPTLSKQILGLSRGRMFVIGGRTSQGKTTLALQMAMDVAKQGFKVFFLSFEMDQRELMLRMLANACEIDANDIRFNISQHRKTTDKIREYFAKPDKFPFLLTYNVGITMGDLNALIADLPKPDVVFVDYIQAIRKVDSDKLTTMNNYIIEFRSLCVKHNFCGVMLSQINRDAMDAQDKKPSLWQLKGSGMLEEHADMVMLCHWDHFYDNAKNKNDYRVTIAKNRQGQTGYVELKYVPEFYKFKDVGGKVNGELVQQAVKMFKGRIIDD